MFWFVLFLGFFLQFLLFAYFFHGRYIFRYGWVKYHIPFRKFRMPMRYSFSVRRRYAAYIPKFIADKTVDSLLEFTEKHSDKLDLTILNMAYRNTEVTLCHDVEYLKLDKTVGRAKGKVSLTDRVKLKFGLMKKYTVFINMGELEKRYNDLTFLVRLMQHEMLHVYLMEKGENWKHDNPLFKEIGI